MATTPQTGPWVKYAKKAAPKSLDQLKVQAAKLKPAALPGQESPDALIPQQEQRIEHAIGVNYIKGKPLPDGAIASVGQFEPHNIVINDPVKFALGPNQTRSHEIIHTLFSNLAGPVMKAIPKDNPQHPYDISQVDELRKKGFKLWNLSQEQAATVLQTYSADPSQRKRLQGWIDDLNNAPLSVVNPTSPNQKGINITSRPPSPPIEAWMDQLGLKSGGNR